MADANDPAPPTGHWFRQPSTAESDPGRTRVPNPFLFEGQLYVESVSARKWSGAVAAAAITPAPASVVTPAAPRSSLRRTFSLLRLSCSDVHAEGRCDYERAQRLGK